ncbi:O-antigen translocase [Photobacterium phosphoreum]|uniref:O-antigen translocase n=1 Tax=Photobacterium phosphoreum TaxID=659 RepID=UPI000D184D08|nr:O-antigen translocase [Photobacterium phosphoreum]PSU76478.1 O-antigen translocase [Photobacterium phosphoreum]
MTLIKTSLLSGIAVFIRIITLLSINKILAIYVGATGYAALGQFQNAIQMLTVFASGAINTGVTKYTAEYNGDEDKQHLVWRTAGSIAAIGSLFTAVFISFFNENLANFFLNDSSYGSVFLWFASTLIFFTLNTLLLAILNGKKDVQRYILANISGSIFAFIVTTILSVHLGLYGALVALSIYQSVSFFVTLLLCHRAQWFKVSYLIGNLDKKIVMNLGKYAAMALVAAICGPISHMFVREHLGETLGWNVAGYWEAMWRLSAAYLMFITTTLSVYYLPRLSELKETTEIKNEIFQGYKIILPVAIIFSVFIYLSRDLIIDILFTSDFMPMRELFAWQVVGDTLKIGGWILTYLLIGQGLTKIYIITEIVFSLIFVLFTMLFTNLFGMEGVSIAHASSYLLYWSSLIIYFSVRYCK